MRRGPEEARHALGNSGVDRFAPDLGTRPDGEIRVAGKKRFYSVLIFARKQRTGRIDQPAAGPNSRRSLVEQSILRRDTRSERLRRQPPAQLRLAAPGARAAARRIDEHDVERSFRRLRELRADNARAGPFGTEC